MDSGCCQWATCSSLSLTSGEQREDNCSDTVTIYVVTHRWGSHHCSDNYSIVTRGCDDYSDRCLTVMTTVTHRCFESDNYSDTQMFSCDDYSDIGV